MRTQEHARHRCKELRSDNAAQDRKASFERVSQADGHIVAVNVEALAGGTA